MSVGVSAIGHVSVSCRPSHSSTPPTPLLVPAGPADPGKPHLSWASARSTVLVAPRRLPSSGAGSGKNLARARRPGLPGGPWAGDRLSMIAKTPDESNDRRPAPGHGAVSRPSHIPVAGAVAPHHAARRELRRLWGSCRRPGGIVGTRDPQVCPRVDVPPGAGPFMLVDQSAQYRPGVGSRPAEIRGRVIGARWEVPHH
jgi:hypothetical protein